MYQLEGKLKRKRDALSFGHCDQLLDGLISGIELVFLSNQMFWSLRQDNTNR